MQSQQPTFRQEQRLRMTPQFYQSIRIMALPLADLKITIDQELERNPALEIVSEEQAESLDEHEENPEEELFVDYSDPGSQSLLTHVDQDTKQRLLEGTPQQPKTLQEYLLWQLRLQPVATEIIRTAERLIHNLDENGFFLEPIQNVAPDASIETLTHSKVLVQGFDPIGTCVANYRESLVVQARLHPKPPANSLEVLSHHIEALQLGRIDEIAETMGISKAEVEEILSFVRTLDPLPGRNFHSEPISYVVPDIVVYYENNALAITLNDEVIPVLGVDRFFEKVGANATGVRREARKFARTSLQEARSFIRCIDSRNQSLVQVTRTIVNYQHEFFRQGPKKLRPLTLRDVAEEIGMHEATVSRIVNGKYVQTEWGIYELRYFFTNSISGAGSSGSRYSKVAVKEIIREIIEAELAHTKRLSDSRIASILEERGIRIARRTVTKYRGELDIESSLDR